MTTEKISVSQQISATPAQVWALIGDFHGIMNWFPGITESRPEGSGVGAIRHLTMADGSVISDRLVAEQTGQSYSYEIAAGEVPMKNYLGTVSVEQSGEGSILLFNGSFDVTDEQREPAIGFIKQIYTGAFDNARQLLET
ncbi:MAG: hypothetical protein DRQ60_11355 [Gammaproteobacteria bacterium]|nr:MAG: hypothetical protein DRQ60_11355 [Gammaproteobacteria bacterium]